MKTTYEWDCEVYDEADVLDHDHRSTAAEMLSAAGERRRHLNPNEGVNLVLVRDVHDVDDDLVDRMWAYVVDGVLPEWFSDHAGNECRVRVPKRFHDEWAKALSASLT